MRVLLLPGMDGGAELLKEFLGELGAEFVAEVLTYRPDVISSYDDLEHLVRERLSREAVGTALIAESFSGPLAIRIAASPPENLRCVVLVATFDRAPAPSLFYHLVTSAMLRVPPPAFVTRHLMLGRDAGDDLVKRVRDAIRVVDAAVLANRLRSVLRVDVAKHTAGIEIPALYLRAEHDRLVRYPLAVPSNPNWEQDTIEGPHLILQRRPVECAKRIRRFIRASI